MSPAGRKGLTREDRILWGKVARSVTPLAGGSPDVPPDGDEDFVALLAPSPPPAAAASPAPAGGPAPAAPSRPSASQHRIDRQTHGKLARGRLPIEGKVDLHGLTQSEAHALLLSFLHRAHADGRRHVLVVTGKGSSLGSDGVLRRAVPAWLATPPFRPLVGGHEPAARHHGGAGALYVRLRRPTGGQGGGYGGGQP